MDMPKMVQSMMEMATESVIKPAMETIVSIMIRITIVNSIITSK